MTENLPENLPENPRAPSRNRGWAYALVGAGLVIVVAALVLVLISRDDAAHDVATLDSTTRPTATAIPPLFPTATAVPPTQRPTQPAASPTTEATASPTAFAVVWLDITVTHPDTAAVAYTVSCNGTETTTCQALARPGVRDRLLYGAPTNQICTEIYGGPDVATIVGTYNGMAIHAVVDRVNGCAIDDWDRLLAGILRPARGVAPPPTPIGLAGFV